MVNESADEEQKFSIQQKIQYWNGRNGVLLHRCKKIRHPAHVKLIGRNLDKERT